MFLMRRWRPGHLFIRYIKYFFWLGFGAFWCYFYLCVDMPLTRATKAKIWGKKGSGLLVNSIISINKEEIFIVSLSSIRNAFHTTQMFKIPCNWDVPMIPPKKDFLRQLERSEKPFSFPTSSQSFLSMV